MYTAPTEKVPVTVRADLLEVLSGYAVRAQQAHDKSAFCGNTTVRECHATLCKRRIKKYDSIRDYFKLPILAALDSL